MRSIPLIPFVVTAVWTALMATPASARDVSVAWDPNPPGENVAGYVVHYGVVSREDASFREYDRVVDTGSATEYTITLDSPTETYYIAVAAYTASGLVSDYSVEIPSSPPTQPVDADGDGYSVQQGDCNDTVAQVHPGAVEICGDGVDNDCVGGDAACALVWYRDADGDQYSDGTTLLHVDRPAGYSLPTELRGWDNDCDDTNPQVHPGAAEICGDSLDNDCSGGDLPCSITWFKDVDGDGFSDGSTLTQSTQPIGYRPDSDLVSTTGDCDDEDPRVNMGATEICGDGLDNDCSGGDLPCSVTWYRDADGDGYSDGTTLAQSSQPAGYRPAADLVATRGDCDDQDPSVFPTAPEICGDGRDNDCTGGDEPCPVAWYKDADGDGYSDGSFLSRVTQPSGYYVATDLVATTGDCDDGDSAVSPAAVEVCGNLVDENCDPGDDICSPGAECPDYDGDGFLDSACGGMDCNDDRPDVFPEALEICGNNVDEDCDGYDAVCRSCPEEGVLTVKRADYDSRKETLKVEGLSTLGNTVTVLTPEGAILASGIPVEGGRWRAEIGALPAEAVPPFIVVENDAWCTAEAITTIRDNTPSNPTPDTGGGSDKPNKGQDKKS